MALSDEFLHRRHIWDVISNDEDRAAAIIFNQERIII